MENEVRSCQCGEPAAFYIVTNWYDIARDENGVCISAEKKSEQRQACMTCLQCFVEQYESAHHMIWKIDDRYQPDGFNYDRLLRESVEAVAKYRGLTVKQFMAGRMVPPSKIRIRKIMRDLGF